MFGYQHEIIKLRLQTNVPELRSLEWYTGQDSTSDKNAAIKATPNLTLTFTTIGDLRTLSGSSIQSAITEVEVMLMTECLLDGDKRIKKDQPTDHLRIFDKIHKYLQGFSAKISYLPEFVGLKGTLGDQRMFNSLTRVGITPPHTPRKAMMKSILKYRAVFYDHAAATLYTTVTPKPPEEISYAVEVAHGTFDYTFDETFD